MMELGTKRTWNTPTICDLDQAGADSIEAAIGVPPEGSNFEAATS